MFDLGQIDGERKILNLSDPVELARRIGTDIKTYSLLKDYFDGTAEVF